MEMEERAVAVADKLHITEIMNKFPYEVSGGQKQRAAIARALITNPSLLLADEPTGALDSRTTDQLLSVFDEINRNGQTIVMVTHSIRCASRANRIILIKDGVIGAEVRKGAMNTEEIYDRVSKII
jgi:putative ABC transport system ATP-binding protein